MPYKRRFVKNKLSRFEFNRKNGPRSFGARKIISSNYEILLFAGIDEFWLYDRFIALWDRERECQSFIDPRAGADEA